MDITFGMFLDGAQWSKKSASWGDIICGVSTFLALDGAFSINTLQATGESFLCNKKLFTGLTSMICRIPPPTTPKNTLLPAPDSSTFTARPSKPPPAKRCSKPSSTSPIWAGAMK